MRERYRFNQVLNETNGLYHELSVKLGLTDSESMIFYQLYDDPDSLTQSDIANATGMSKQTVNSAIRKLEAEGILTLKKRDRKSKCITVTEYGTAYIRSAIQPMVEMEERILRSWAAEDLSMYLELTERYLLHLRREVEAYGKA